MLTDRTRTTRRWIPPLRGGNTDTSPLRGRGSRGASCRAVSVIAALVTILSCLTGIALAQTPVQGDLIVNSAQLTSVNMAAVSASNTVTTVVRTKSVIEFLEYAPSATGATKVTVPATAYRAGTTATSPFVTLPPPVPAGSTTPIDLQQPVPLETAGVFHEGEPIFVRVTDPDQNLDRTRTDTIFITLTSPATGDTEVLRLAETGPDTGVFLGYMQTMEGTAATNSGDLVVHEGKPVQASYTDPADPTDSSTTAAMVDPFGILFDSTTGQPVDGATVTLVDTTTGQPATVLGDDGVHTYPATVTSGGTATDSGGKVYDFPPGGYRFPFIRPGNYRLTVIPPAGYAAPSTVPTDTLQKLPGGPFAIVTPGSRGEPFYLNPGPALRIDIPLDPVATSLWVQKSASQTTAAPGDFVQYRVTVQNTSDGGTAPGVIVTDRLPIGFRYRQGSTRIDGQQAPDPTQSNDGRTLTFPVGDIAAKTTREIRYVLEVAAGAHPGPAVNLAQAGLPGGGMSNLASATVTIRDDFLRSRTILMGRVIGGACGGDDTTGPGIAGVRIYLEDGTFTVTDKKGRYHFEGLTPGTHVVQLDLDSLPEGDVALPCEANTRFSGRAYSQFVDLQGGTMWRTDFHVGPREAAAPVRKEPSEHLPPAVPPAGRVALRFASTLDGERSASTVTMAGDGAVPVTGLLLTVTLPDGVGYEKGSSRLDGEPTADPVARGNTLVWKLPDRRGKWHCTLRFTAHLGKNARVGQLESRAVLRFDTPAAAGLATPPAENIIVHDRHEELKPLPPFVLRPQFPTLGAELSASDRDLLDELARLLLVLKVERITVTGYTDNMPIAPRNRHRYRDNRALSLARARSVGTYLRQALHLPPDKLAVAGMGASRPVADNRTAAGRAQNRRVEIVVVTSRSIDTNRFDLTVPASDRQKSWSPSPLHTAKKKTTSVVPSDPGKKPAAAPAEKEKTEGLLSPSEGEELVDRVGTVRVKLDSRLKQRLFLDGTEISSDRIGFRRQDRKSGMTLSSYFGIDFGGPGRHILRLEGTDPFGNVRFRESVTVVRTGDVGKIRLLDASGNVADGTTPVRLRVELFDTAGVPIKAPAELELRGGTLLPPLQENGQPDARSGPPLVKVDADGWVSFRPVAASGPYHAVLAFKDVTLEADTYVRPKLRDWILVGLGEGTAGYSTLSGHMEELQAAGAEENLYENGRLAFFARGQIQGKWLLTMAYDTAKTRPDAGNGLFQQIDPNTYYTLYGDASQQGYDAASARKLYLRIERDQFYALFGDFDTGLTVTELSRYSRRLNGIKSELRTKHVEANVFASETGQAYVRDELPGDGTSGLYHLSRGNIVLNSETVTIEVRDRFRSDVIVSSRTLTRFLDYSIDSQAGTIFFKEPVPSRDENFNPVYVVVEYEAGDTLDGTWTYGGRAGVRLMDDRVKVGGTYIHEGEGGGAGNLYGADTAIVLTDTTRLKGEFATSSSDAGGNRRDGNAYLAELSHRTKKLDAKLYVREQDDGFGLGQQNGSESGTRKYGADGLYHFTDAFSAAVQGYRQYTLTTGAERELAEAQVKYAEKLSSILLGLRQVSDTLGDGSVHRSSQIFAGASLTTLAHRLTLRVNHDQSFGNNSNADFPTRTLLGADYRLTRAVSLFAEQEFTRGSSEDSNSTRAGIKATPWEGGQISSGAGQEIAENGQRVFATLGLKQTWQVTERWSVDGSLDRSQTLKHPGNYQLNVNVPPASGTTDDFTAVSLGSTYKEKRWSWAQRLEYRTSQTEEKWGGFTGILGELREGIGLSARAQLFYTDTSTGSVTTSGDLRFGLAFRPQQSRWILLDRLDLLLDRQSGTGTDIDNRRVVNNLNANWTPERRIQLALQYGAKYVWNVIDGGDYSGYTDLVGLEGRYDLTPKWDVGARGSVLHSWGCAQFSYSLGASLGYNVMQNAWVSLGYNLLGFSDRDFSAADYTAQGPFVRFRFKFDQNSVHDAVKWLDRG